MARKGLSLGESMVLITGAAQGMGRLLVERAKREGCCQIVAWDIDVERLAQLRQEMCVDERVRLYTQVVDLADLKAIEAAVVQLQAEFGLPNILINNAGVVCGDYFWGHRPVEDIQHTMAVNTLAPMQLTRALLPAMLAGQKPCRIVNIASAAALVSNPKMSVYAASKWALLGWSDSLRLELVQAGHAHVKVTTVCPTYINTGMFAGAKPLLMTPMLQPDAVVDQIWLAMKAGRPQLLLPWTVRLSKIVKGLLPLSWWDVVAEKVFKIYDSMSEFKGRAHGPAPADKKD
ncbi:MAG: SDR family NAD(P)-dependent oxidoreductase [Neisseriaceae bacterium]|nr:SDR family NAD(P)-dependent oxidoreductase [Neisseriaceae bacterium]